MPSHSAMVPTDIRVQRDARLIELTWDDGRVTRFPARFLRGRCPCASCVNENTGERMVDVDAVPIDLTPTAVALSGNYAIKITWSDGHDTGLYTWEWLDHLARELARIAS